MQKRRNIIEWTMVYHIYVTRIMYHNEIYGINMKVCIKWINRMLSRCNKTKEKLNKHFKVKIERFLRLWWRLRGSRFQKWIYYWISIIFAFALFKLRDNFIIEQTYSILLQLYVLLNVGFIATDAIAFNISRNLKLCHTWGASSKIVTNRSDNALETRLIASRVKLSLHSTLTLLLFFRKIVMITLSLTVSLEFQKR